MTTATNEDAWAELRRLAGIGGGPSKARVVLDENFGAEDGSGAMFFDAEGKDRTALVRALVFRLDDTHGMVGVLAERVKVLERLAVHDEARLSAEIEQLRDRNR